MIEVKNAVMRFDDKNALDGVSLTIPEGCAYGLLGSNGAGKSTLLRALSGIYRLSSGELFIDGEPVYDNAKVKERVFFINDETVQFNTMTLTEKAVLQELLRHVFRGALAEALQRAESSAEKAAEHLLKGYEAAGGGDMRDRVQNSVSVP